MRLLSTSDYNATMKDIQVALLFNINSISTGLLDSQFLQESLEGKSCIKNTISKTLVIKMLHDMIWNDILSTNKPVSLVDINTKYGSIEKLNCFIDNIIYTNKRDFLKIGNVLVRDAVTIQYDKANDIIMYSNI